MQPTSFVLADSQMMFLDGLAAVLTARGHTVEASTTEWLDLLEAISTRNPDVCIIEAETCPTSVKHDLATLTDLSPTMLIVVLTVDDSSEQLHQALGGGAVGYVHKTHGVVTLLDVLSRVSEGEVVIKGSFTRRRPVGSASAEVARLAENLTPRENECLVLLTEGWATAEMSAKLGVSTTTVRTHIQAVLTKLGAHSRLEAAAMATRYGIVEQGESERLPA